MLQTRLQRRALAIFSILALLTGAAAATAPEVHGERISFQTLYLDLAANNEERYWVITDQDELDAFYRDHAYSFAEESEHVVDFDTEMVIAAMAGHAVCDWGVSYINALHVAEESVIDVLVRTAYGGLMGCAPEMFHEAHLVIVERIPGQVVFRDEQTHLLLGYAEAE